MRRYLSTKNVITCMPNSFAWSSPKRAAQDSINVSSYARDKYKIFSPFSHNEKYAIPVPGDEKTRADSVEGIWQGLKIINRSIDPTLFKGKPRKREGNVEGHLFGEQTIGYSEARKRIYVPAYVYHAVNNGLTEKICADLEQRLKKGTVVFHDVNSNGNINDISTPYSHAALLADLLNVLKDSPLPPFNKERCQYLKPQVEATLNYRIKLRDHAQFLLDEVITFAYLFSQDELKEAFALHAIMLDKELKELVKERLKHFMPCEKNKSLYDVLRR